MYSDPTFDPPNSQIRQRPWSPEPSYPADDVGPLGGQYYRTTDDLIPHSQLKQRREASDASVEALDLADYARTLRARQSEDPYPAFPSHLRQAHYPPTHPQPAARSRDSLERYDPSLISRGPTLSSTSTHHTLSSSPASQGRRTTRRPFSLPNTPVASQANSSRGHLPPSSYKTSRIFEAGPHHTSTDEIDISSFPKWSRGWYDSNNSTPKYNTPVSNQSHFDHDDMYTPIPQSRLDSLNFKGNNKSFFDPGYVHNRLDNFGHDPYDHYDVPPPMSTVEHESSRNLLPWGADPPEYGPPLDPLLKEERMRMLEREFGTNAKKKDKNASPWINEEGKPLIGTVDKHGNLVTVGPRKRIAVRILQIALALGAAIPSIYAAVAIKSTDPRDLPPPPANKPPAYVLYVVSSLTFIFLLYLFVVRPCCCGRRKPKSAKHGFPGASNMGMMVLPVGGPGKKGKKDKGSKKGGKYGPPGQDVQVNLIVDPTAFQPPEESDTESEGEYDEEAIPGSFEERQHTRRRKRNRRRRGVFEGLAMEADWKVARAWLKKLTAVDVAGMVLWGAVFVFVMIGKRCPTGEYDGWCNAYNVSTASACLLCVAFGVSTFFDVQDLHASKQSPRTRT